MSARRILALLEHKFNVSKIDAVRLDEEQYGPVTSIVHNGVNLTLQLYMRGNVKGLNRAGLFIGFLSGPVDALKLEYSFFAVKGQGSPETIRLTEGREDEFTSKYKKLLGGSGAVCLPNTFEKLRAEGYLCNDSILHVFAVLFIPQSAFEDPRNKCPASSAQNPFFHHQFGEIGTPTATNSPFYNRLELISKDGDRFWVHKDVLAFNSDVFKWMFDPDKPEEARYKYLREGKITLENASGGALKEMLIQVEQKKTGLALHRPANPVFFVQPVYIYLKHTTPDFNTFAMELVPVAEMYELNGLRLLCVQALIVQAKNEKDIVELLRILDVSHLHKLSEVETACVDSLKREVQNENVDRELILKVTKLAHEHRHDQLKSVCEQSLMQHVKKCQNLTVPIIHELAADADKYGLNNLLAACGEWLGLNWETARSTGQLSDMMEDKTGGLFTRLMAFAVKK